MKTEVYFSKVKPDGIVPSKDKENAGMDIYCCFDEEFVVIHPHETRKIPTGIASSCSTDYYFQLFERGSTGTKGIGQRCGVIDSGFRGEWFIPVTNHNNYTIVIAKDFENKNRYQRMYGNFVIIYPYTKAICQAVLLPVPEVDILEIDYEALNNIKSNRGTNCLGSTSK